MGQEDVAGVHEMDQEYTQRLTGNGQAGQGEEKDEGSHGEI